MIFPAGGSFHAFTQYIWRCFWKTRTTPCSVLDFRPLLLLCVAVILVPVTHCLLPAPLRSSGCSNPAFSAPGLKRRFWSKSLVRIRWSPIAIRLQVLSAFSCIIIKYCASNLVSLSMVWFPNWMTPRREDIQPVPGRINTRPAKRSHLVSSSLLVRCAAWSPKFPLLRVFSLFRQVRWWWTYCSFCCTFALFTISPDESPRVRLGYVFLDSLQHF